MGRCLTRQVTTSSCFVATGIVQVEIKKCWICLVALQNHLIEGSCNFMSGSSSFYDTTLSILVIIGILLVQIKCFSESRDLTKPHN